MNKDKKVGNKRFTVYDSEANTVLELINELGSLTNNVCDSLDNKTDLFGDHKGSWQGLNRPTMSEEGMRATVEDIIDNKIPSIETSLDNIKNRMEDNVLIIDSKYFKNKNHGQAIEDIINNTTATKIIFPKQDYEIDGTIIINKNDIELDFSNATLKWTNTVPLSSSSDYLGMLWVKGNVVGDKININSYNKSINEKRYGVVECNSIGNLKVGDFIEINCDTGEWLKDYSNFRPALNTIAKIVAIDGNEITIDHYAPFDFSVGTFNGTIQKVNAVGNVKIKNMKYIDTITPVDSDNRQSWSSGIALKYCNNVILENNKIKSVKNS